MIKNKQNFGPTIKNKPDIKNQTDIKSLPEDPKYPNNPKKLLVIIITLLLHLLIILIVFFILQYANKDYLFFKPQAKIKFERRPLSPQLSGIQTPQNISGLHQMPNMPLTPEQLKALKQAQIKQLENQKQLELLKKLEQAQKELEQNKSQFEFPNLPRYQGLNKLYKKKSEKEESVAQDFVPGSKDNITLADLSKIYLPHDKEIEKILDKNILDQDKAKKLEPEKKPEIKQEPKFTPKSEIKQELKPELTKIQEPSKEPEIKPELPKKPEPEIKQIKESEKKLTKAKNTINLLEEKKLEEKIQEKLLEQKEITKQESKTKEPEPETQQFEEYKIEEPKNPRDFVIKKETKTFESSQKAANPFERLAKAFGDGQVGGGSNGKGGTKDSSKKNMSLKEISEGFLDYSLEQGGNFIQYTNAIEGAPTEEQLKHERYIKKIFDCIEITMKIKSRSLRFRKQLDPYQILTVLINITLNNDGKVNNASIAQTSGFEEFDRFMLSMLRYSSNAFPPVPGYLSKNTYYMPVKFIIPVYMVQAN